MTASAARPGGLAPREWAVAAALVLAFAPALHAMASLWLRVDYLSHGFLVPLVALWVLLRERPRRAALPRRPTAWGAILLLGAVAAYLAGFAGGIVSLQGAALVMAVAGAVAWLRGGAWLRALAFPVAFLIFMVPPPASWTTPLIVRLQVWVSAAAVQLLHAAGSAVLRDGNVLLLPGGESLFVAEACSGITSIITLAPLGVLLAYLNLRRTLPRVLLVLSVAPLAMLGNLVRVVVTVVGASHFGAGRVTEGPLHTGLGMLTYVVACGLMIGLDALLHRLESRGG